MQNVFGWFRCVITALNTFLRVCFTFSGCRPPPLTDLPISNQNLYLTHRVTYSLSMTHRLYTFGTSLITFGTLPLRSIHPESVLLRCHFSVYQPQNPHVSRLLISRHKGTAARSASGHRRTGSSLPFPSAMRNDFSRLPSPLLALPRRAEPPLARAEAQRAERGLGMVVFSAPLATTPAMSSHASHLHLLSVTYEFSSQTLPAFPMR